MFIFILFLYIFKHLHISNFYRFKNEVHDLLSKSKKCKKSNALEFENLVDGYARDELNLICGDYTEESDKCEKIIDKTPKWTKPLPSTSFVNALVATFQSIY